MRPTSASCVHRYLSCTNGRPRPCLVVAARPWGSYNMSRAVKSMREIGSIDMKMSGHVRISGHIICVGLSSLLAISVFAHGQNTPVLQPTGASLQDDTHQASGGGPSQDRKSVLVELITSAECHVCESEERLLSHLDRDQPIQNADIIVLSERVKPQDPSVPSGYLSPTDPTRRQENYQSIGTSSQPVPRFIVNGVLQDEHASGSQIEEAIRLTPESLVPLRLTSVQIRGDDMTFALEGGPVTKGYVNVYAALVDLPRSSSEAGKQDVEHLQTGSGVVETFGRVGSSFRTKALGNGPFTIQSHIPDNRKSFEGMRLIVFVQTKHVGLVLGSTSCVLGSNSMSPLAAIPANRCPPSASNDLRLSPSSR